MTGEEEHMTTYKIKRVYEAPEPDDGYRVLVDRVWPRGMSKERAELSEWSKDVAPTTELRTWFGHLAARFPEFTERYTEELANNRALNEAVARWDQHATVTLVYSARDTEHNQAVVLQHYLASHSSTK
jgi:uncharacterized protein YeaO (DUF488 family)